MNKYKLSVKRPVSNVGFVPLFVGIYDLERIFLPFLGNFTTGSFGRYNE
ncbi:MAG: hypothetical protein IAE91_05845 [Ignavibacteriaceae bacterium]|nr:hypothetical protein [Ignavibacteriaceae bacterium]